MMCVCVCSVVHTRVCLCERCSSTAFPRVEELCVSLLVGLCRGINSRARRAWLPPREAQSCMFILHLRRLLADEDVHMQD